MPDTQLVSAARDLCTMLDAYCNAGNARLVLNSSIDPQTPLIVHDGEISAHSRLMIESKLEALKSALRALPRIDRFKIDMDFILEDPGEATLEIHFTTHFNWDAPMILGHELLGELERRLIRMDRDCPSGVLCDFTVQTKAKDSAFDNEWNYAVRAASALEARYAFGLMRSHKWDLARATEDLCGITLDCPPETWKI